MEKKLFILFLCMIPVVAFGISFNQAYYSQQKFSPKTASWNDPVGMFISEAVEIIERRDMDDPNSTKIKGPNHKLVFGPEDPNDDDFYFIWNDPNDMGLYADDSGGNAVFHFGTEDANTIDVDLNGDLDVSGDTLIGGTLGVTGEITGDTLANDNGIVFTDSSGTLENGTDLTWDGTNLVVDANVIATGRVRQGKTYHAYGGFQDAATTITVAAANTWYHVTNATNDLWSGLEADGITVSGDKMTFTNGGDYTGIVTIDLSALLNKDYHLRLYNNTDSVQVAYRMGVSTSGAGNNVPITLPLYIEANAGDEFQLEIECTTSATDVVLDNAIFYVQYLHD